MSVITTGELDLAYDTDTLDETLAELEQTYGVTVTVTQVRGPAGGWPVVTVTGERDAVERCVREWWATEDADHEAWLFGQILPA